jgi:hypothetical protein
MEDEEELRLLLLVQPQPARVWLQVAGSAAVLMRLMWEPARHPY